MTNQFRAGKACTHCHRRRVKCNASQTGPPCTRCQQKELDCAFIQTKRGTYDRKARSLQPQAGSAPLSPAFLNSNGKRSTRETTQEHGAGETRRGALTSSSGARASPPQLEATGNRLPGTKVLCRASGNFEVPSLGSAAAEESSWGRVFEQVFESRQNERQYLDKSSITYLGEACPLAIILGLDEFQDGGHFRVHHRVPSQYPNEKRASHLEPEDLAFLEAKGVFNPPEKEVLDALISTFMERVYPIYPIVNSREFLSQHRQVTIPWLLLHSVCFIASTYCREHVIHAAGFTERDHARVYFYKKAKATFDIGYEKNKVTVLQSAIILSFRLGAPDEQYNYYSWMSTAVTTAEMLGIHRSTAAISMSDKDKSLFRRLWWILVVRDAFTAAVWGRTMRIDIDQCDAEMITPADFDLDWDPSDINRQKLAPNLIAYQIAVFKFALLLRDSVRYRVSEQTFDAQAERLSLEKRLEEWRQTLVPVVDWDCHSVPGTDRFSAALAIYYYDLIIFLNLQKPIIRTLSPSSEDLSEQKLEQTAAEASYNMAQDAAQRMTTLAGALVTSNLLCSMPHETFIGIFSAEVVLFTQIVSDNKPCQIPSTIRPTNSQLAARSQLAICQMAMHTVRSFWDSASWVIRLFEKLLASPAANMNGTADTRDESGGRNRRIEELATAATSGNTTDADQGPGVRFAENDNITTAGPAGFYGSNPDANQADAGGTAPATFPTDLSANRANEQGLYDFWFPASQGFGHEIFSNAFEAANINLSSMDPFFNI